MKPQNFVLAERDAQAAFLAHTVPPEMIHERAAYRLRAGQRLLNLAPIIRDAAQSYFSPERHLVWHQHANHGLSSQACCINFLMPLATQPEILANVIESALGITNVRMLPINEGRNHQEPWYIGFEWIGRANCLGEWPKRGNATRGANATSADAAVRFEHEGRVEIVLIEWKYTERYGATLIQKGNPTRIHRYAEKAFAPNGPIRADLDLKLEDFFWEPLYQLLRQQMLAWQMERAREDGAERVSILHISPADNVPLHKITSPALRRFGDDVFSVFRGFLVEPDRFTSVTTEQVFGPFLSTDHDDPAAKDWASYLRDRYRFLSAVRNPNG